jgi:MFS family permease
MEQMEIVMLDNLGTIENRVYRTYWNDGLLDLFAAVGVLGVGISWMLDFAVGAAIMPALLLPLWGPCRQRFIEPRLGLVEFSDAREQRNSNLLKQVALLGFGFFALGVAMYVLRDRIDLDPAVNLIAGLPAVLLGLLAVMAAILVASARFLIYAALLVIAGAVGALLGWEPGLILTQAGAGMFIIALAVLMSFLRNNPVSDETPE